MSTSDRRERSAGPSAAPAVGPGSSRAARRRHERANPDVTLTARSWLWDHIGRVAGITLGLLAFAGMVFLAAIGFKPALFLIVLLVAGVAIIAVGGRIRSA